MRAATRTTGIALLGTFALAATVTWGPDRLRPWACHTGDPAPTAAAALASYYSGCWDRPSVAGRADLGPVPAGPGSAGQAWAHQVDFAVRYGDGRIRFLLVGQQRPGDRWRVVAGEASGP